MTLVLSALGNQQHSCLQWLQNCKIFFHFCHPAVLSWQRLMRTAWKGRTEGGLIVTQIGHFLFAPICARPFIFFVPLYSRWAGSLLHQCELSVICYNFSAFRVVLLFFVSLSCHRLVWAMWAQRWAWNHSLSRLRSSLSNLSSFGFASPRRRAASHTGRASACRLWSEQRWEEQEKGHFIQKVKRIVKPSSLSESLVSSWRLPGARSAAAVHLWLDTERNRPVVANFGHGRIVLSSNFTVPINTCVCASLLLSHSLLLFLLFADLSSFLCIFQLFLHRSTLWPQLFLFPAPFLSLFSVFLFFREVWRKLFVSLSKEEEEAHCTVWPRLWWWRRRWQWRLLLIFFILILLFVIILIFLSHVPSFLLFCSSFLLFFRGVWGCSSLSEEEEEAHCTVWPRLWWWRWRWRWRLLLILLILILVFVILSRAVSWERQNCCYIEEGASCLTESWCEWITDESQCRECLEKSGTWILSQRINLRCICMSAVALERVTGSGRGIRKPSERVEVPCNAVNWRRVVNFLRCTVVCLWLSQTEMNQEDEGQKADASEVQVHRSAVRAWRRVVHSCFFKRWIRRMCVCHGKTSMRKKRKGDWERIHFVAFDGFHFRNFEQEPPMIRHSFEAW